MKFKTQIIYVLNKSKMLLTKLKLKLKKKNLVLYHK